MWRLDLCDPLVLWTTCTSHISSYRTSVSHVEVSPLLQASRERVIITELHSTKIALGA